MKALGGGYLMMFTGCFRMGECMDIKLKRRAVRVFPRVSYQPLTSTKQLRRKWLVAVYELGDRWILSTPVTRKEAV